jgi:phytol kinase
MHEFASRFTGFFVENFPSWKTLLLAGPPGLLWAYACLYLAGYLKKTRGLKTGYTRKIFHFLIFATVAVIHALYGTSGVCLFGAMTSLVIFYALLRGNGHLLYEAMAREKDEPHRTYFIVAPYFATLLGGLASNIFFGPAAIVGYLATGFGDAVGEPVGVRFGRHTYAVPSLRGVKSFRSYEGSAAVFLACTAAVALAVILSPHWQFTGHTFIMIPLLGLACAAVEAVSPHGWDNATLQIVPSLLAVLLLR